MPITFSQYSIGFHSITLSLVKINPEAEFVWLVRVLLRVIVLYEFLHGLHAAFADVPEILLQRGLDGALQGRILLDQHLCHKAKHFTLLIVLL